MDSLIVCWDVDPGADTDGIGSADDDCDFEGENLTWSWQNSGTYNVVFHATDNNGARNSSSASVTVLNLPPIVMVNTPTKVVAGETVILDASKTMDSPIDKEYLTIVWDVDCSVDNDGDGIKDNDADYVGPIVEYEFPRAGKFKIKAIAWDEEIMRPSSKSVIIEVDSPDMTAFEQVVESMTGETANPFFQLVGISLVIVGLVFFLKRGQKKRDSVWDEENLPDIVAPLEAPSLDVFSDVDTTVPDMIELDETLSLPEDGLPEGWTMEQWEYYGHQYQGGQDTENKHNEM
tara:strand:- start:30 stop:899 length:870 start_codon:yes stop_codon:yes gene_type:complete